ncbi:MAG: DUF1801 domain-containing protein [Candidatus Moraniibacteriota bacterium]|nr:MAG: DUF1801 domain-containing protein [Candidatus Moranbacteria bacterium]
MMKMKAYTNIDEYISNFPSETQAILEKIRVMARKSMPSDATEAIRYGIPTIQIGGKNVLHFAGYESHIGVYPASDDMMKSIPELVPYRTGKGTLQFKIDREIPYRLIKEVVNYLSP